MGLKAIKTEYKGYLFKSRLDARWAVFLDALGADWEYEPERYDLWAMEHLLKLVIRAHYAETIRDTKDGTVNEHFGIWVVPSTKSMYITMSKLTSHYSRSCY